NTPLPFLENLNTGNSSTKKAHLTEFNPNNLNEEQWMNLGFSKRQVATILKYKSVVGGNFTSKEQLKKCYAISEEKYTELEPYLMLSDNVKKSNLSQNYGSYYKPRTTSYHYTTSSNKGLSIPGKFNPDSYNTNDFINLGFTEKQANSILKYKNYLGGSFISKEKFKECYIISEENYRKLAPYLLLPERISENRFDKKQLPNYTISSEKPAITYSNFDPNTTNLEGWRNLGFSEKQAYVIINYRDKNLKGGFKSLEDIARCFVISAEKFEQIKPFIILNSENTSSKNSDHQPLSSNNSQNQQPSKTINNAETKTDFKKTDLNEITFKHLIEFGFDEKSAGMIIGFRKKLGGFVNKQQIIDTYDIDKDLAQKLVAIANLDDSKVAKYTLVDAPEEWLKNHPYFKYSADKIIYYRISYPDEKKIWKFIKVKPEYETRMKMYLK
ncbi:helix-hairpin-helix domain-containing protein, partial [Kaistella sp.]|uniref:helix-hairpin-helix domain-containing protein n=1 Tax=Kaistella sp. TaxID=2782235 RepID=UPI003C42144A